MKYFLSIVCLFLCFQNSFSQDGFEFKKNQKNIKIPFKMVNNLVIIPIDVNGVKMNFLLDTGVEETILFSIEDKTAVELFNVEKITLRGLGNENAAEGLKSTGNVLSFSKLSLKNQTIIIILDETFNFSASLGVPVNGIIGYHFFKENLVEINYESKKVIVHNQLKLNPRKLKKYEAIDISIEKNKPYLISNVIFQSKILPSKLLIDSGNSDAIWVFQNKTDNNLIPTNNFEDYLGRGFSGDIYGKRAIIKGFEINNFKFNKPLVAFPDNTSLSNVVLVQDRIGSIGAGILKRFNVFFDYNKSKLYLKKNSYFDEPFAFNKSGITIQNSGVQYIKEKVNENLRSNIVKIEIGEREVDFNYKFELKPVYEISHIRKGTPADEIGLQKGDVILSINNVLSYQYSLEEINNLFKSEEGRVILIEIERNKIILKKKFKLRSIL